MKKIRRFYLLFPYLSQNPIVHQVTLTFGDHAIDIESKNCGSLLFLFGQILVRTI
jgi:hypothetical protein